MMYRIGSIVVFCSLLLGCAGASKPVLTDYDTMRDRTTYRANSISVPIESRGMGYGNQLREVRMSLWARCEGRGCQPDEARLTLSTSGGSEVYLGERTFVLVADGERFIWEDPQYDRRNRTERVVGMILRVSMDVDTLEKVARAATVEGKVGSLTLELDGRAQERIRSFVAELGREVASDPA